MCSSSSRILTLRNEELKVASTTQSLTDRLIKINECRREDLYNEINSIAEAYVVSVYSWKILQQQQHTKQIRENSSTKRKTCQHDLHSWCGSRSIHHIQEWSDSREHQSASGNEQNEGIEQTIGTDLEGLDCISRRGTKSLQVSVGGTGKSKNHSSIDRCKTTSELEENTILNSTKRRVEFRKDVENLRTMREKMKRSIQLEMKVNRLKEDLNVLRWGWRMEMWTDTSRCGGDGRKSTALLLPQQRTRKIWA